MTDKRIEERAATLHGVKGRMLTVIPWYHGNRTTFMHQQFESEARPVPGHGVNSFMSATLRFDDNPRNGHNSFAITAEMRDCYGRIEACGCLHEYVAQVFPEFAHLIKWHLASTDGPMHYIVNTVYHASDRDHNGLLAGESRQIRNGKSRLLAWKLENVDTQGNVIKPTQYIDSDTQPESPGLLAYVPWCMEGNGKERNLQFARSSAVWSEATDEQLCLPKEELTALLQARLPALMAEFKRDILACGFLWDVSDMPVQP